MSVYVAQIESAVEATTMLSATTFAWYGIASPRLLPHVMRALTAQSARDYLLYNMQQRLYHDFYCQGAASIPTDRNLQAGGRADLFKERLQKANKGTGSWDPGWSARPAEEGHLLAERNGLALVVAGKQYRATGESGGEPDIANVEIFMGKDLPDISPGFYMALGDSALAGQDERDLVRLYWHVDATGAVLLMEAATEALNDEGVPFKLKVVNHPDDFARCDAAVLYMRAGDFHAGAAVIDRTYRAVQAHLEEGVPALTRRLARGLGIAEDLDGQSFGLHRCMLIAEGLARAYDEDRSRPEERLISVLERFRQAGVDPGRPYLRPASQREYELPSLHGRVAVPARGDSASTSRAGAVRKEEYLRTAEQIGARIVRDAVWRDEQCNWIGAVTPGTRDVPHAASGMGALGPDLYAGTSGVGLFLAELFAATGDPPVRRTAAGALRQALANSDRLPEVERPALYTGALGTVFAGVRAGHLLEEAGLVQGARRLLGSLLEQYEHLQPDFGHDYLSGRAGAIVGLLTLEGMWGDMGLRDVAVRLGDDLLSAANETGRGFSWPRMGSRNRRDLTGLSHGAAGIGIALLELYRATGETRFRHAAEMAFRYERAWFDPEEANWPDFRFEQRHPRRGKGAAAYRTFWCHGAPGIALTRLRGYVLLREPVYLEEAATALDTTRVAVERSMQTGMRDFSLCHGLAGNCEVLLAGVAGLVGTVDSPQAALLRDTALQAAGAGIERFGRRDTQSHRESPWPCGVGGGHTPSLMLGTAGIGLFYLRLYRPETPTPLAGLSRASLQVPVLGRKDGTSARPPLRSCPTPNFVGKGENKDKGR